MVSHTLILTKVVGTVSLGALAGSVLSTTQIALPLLLLPKKPEDLNAALTKLREQSYRLFSPLAITSFSSLAISYIVASSASKHPYLIYSALSVPIVAAISYFKALPVYNSLLAESSSSDLATAADISSVSSAQTTPVTQDGSPTLSAASAEDDVEHSALDNSVYRNISKSDYEDSSEDKLEASQILEQTKEAVVKPVELSVQPIQEVSSSNVAVLVSKLTQFGNIASTVSSLAFVIATVGIYGDMAKR